MNKIAHCACIQREKKNIWLNGIIHYITQLHAFDAMNINICIDMTCTLQVHAWCRQVVDVLRNCRDMYNPSDSASSPRGANRYQLPPAIPRNPYNITTIPLLNSQKVFVVSYQIFYISNLGLLTNRSDSAQRTTRDAVTTVSWYKRCLLILLTICAGYITRIPLNNPLIWPKKYFVSEMVDCGYDSSNSCYQVYLTRNQVL